MRTLTFPFRGAPRPVHVLEGPEDLGPFQDWLTEPRRALALDTETTGRDIYARGFRVRLVQFGDTEASYVLPVERGAWAWEAVTRALLPAPRLVLHNATYDLLALDHAEPLGLGLEWLAPKAWDTRILAHLLDPRVKAEGGTGHGLKELAAHWLDPDAPDSQQALKRVFREELGLKSEEEHRGWALVDLDHPEYLRYAGADTILTAHLFEALGPEVKERGMTRLATFEHDVARLLARIQRRGLLVDVPYLEDLQDTLTLKRQEGEAAARLWGVDNVESTAQVAEALLGMGEELTETTPTGKLKVDKAVLSVLADLDLGGERIGAREPNPLAAAVLKAKQAAKFRTAFVDAMLDLRDEDNRVHPNINGLQARTARMSIARPPFQQLPSRDATIRDAVLADPGHVLISSDYSQVELRVLAALAQERKMLEAIAAGVDLHDTTAAAIWGEDFTKAQRKLAKTVGFGKVYGGGAKTLARQAGVTFEQAREAAGAYDRAFPGIKRYARALQHGAEYGAREVVTPSGRHLPLDRDRLYAATNYVVQSTARDVLAQALLELDEAGLGDNLLLPIHDEVLAQAPASDAQEVAKLIGETMTMDFQGVNLEAEGEVYGERWGDGYR